MLIHKNISFRLLLIIFFLLLFTTISGISTGDNCQDCHGTDGGYTYKHVSVNPVTPRVVAPSEEFEHIITLNHPGHYIASSITVELDLSSASNLELTSPKKIQVGDFDTGSKKITFDIKAGEPHQSQKIRTIVTYTANLHYDPTAYTEILDITITIDEIVLEPSSWTLDLKTESDSVLILEAFEPVKNITIIPSDSLDGVVKLEYSLPSQMSSGEKMNIKIDTKKAGYGKINYIYEDKNGLPHKATIDIIVTPESEGLRKIWEPIGLIGGISSWVLLFLMTIIGAPIKKFKPRFNKFFGNAVVRNEFHCAMSYILVVLALFHAVVVMGNHWNGAMLANSFIIADPSNDYGLYINLGAVAWIFMILVSVTGIFWKQLIKILKYQVWRWAHNIFTMGALISAIIHGSLLLQWRFF
jgi:hypothetical protein